MSSAQQQHKTGEIISSSSLSHWDEVLASLKRNELIELRLGWCDASTVISSSRVLLSLAKALKANTSLRRIMIGWHWLRHQRDLFCQLLVTLADSIRPHQLQSIQMILNGWVPTTVLARFLKSQTSLSILDLQALTVRHVNWKRMEKSIKDGAASTIRTQESDSMRSTGSAKSTGSIIKSINKTRRSKRNKQSNPSGHFSSKIADYDGPSESTVVPVVLDPFMANLQHHALSELRLVDCNLEDKDVFLLAEHIVPTSFLSVRGNRRLTGRGAAALVEVAQDTLDLSLCDFGPYDFVTIAKAIGNRGDDILEEVRFSGNYRMEVDGLNAVLETVPFFAKSLELSYCDMSEVMTITILQTLVEMGRKRHELEREICLRELSMKGCRIGSVEANHALVELLRQNSPPLRSLILHDDKNEKKYVSLGQMQEIAEGMPQNYEMEDLQFDYHKNVDLQRTWREIENWLRLNRAGRRLIRPYVGKSPHATEEIGRKVVAAAVQKDMEEWISLLNAVKEEDNLDLIYWVARNSVDRLKC